MYILKMSEIENLIDWNLYTLQCEIKEKYNAWCLNSYKNRIRKLEVKIVSIVDS